MVGRLSESEDILHLLAQSPRSLITRMEVENFKRMEDRSKFEIPSWKFKKFCYSSFASLLVLRIQCLKQKDSRSGPRFLFRGREKLLFIWKRRKSH